VLMCQLMMRKDNVLILDEPTNHLDLESITALNNGLISFREVVLFASHDHEFVATVANRIVEITPGGIIDRTMGFEEYLENTEVAEERDRLCHGHLDLTL